MSDTGPDDYYVAQKGKLLKELDKVIGRIQPELAARYGETAVTEIRREVLQEFARLLPEIPYIGGKKNKLTVFLIQSAWALSFYRVVQRRGGDVAEAGEILHQAAEAMFNAIPVFLRHGYGRIRFHKWRYPAMAAAARETQKREYPGNWVQEFVAGDSETFDFGYDYTECGIVKFLEAQNAPELIPYLCQTDFAAAEALGFHLTRPETIAAGDGRCNFRFSRK